MINQLKKIIKEKRNEDVKILSIFKTGSSLFCNNYNDIDYVVVVDKPIKRLHYFNTETKEDFFIYSEEERNKELNFNSGTTGDVYSICETFKQYGWIYGEKTINFDIFSKADEYKAMLRNILPNWCLSSNLKWKNSDLYCNKKLWWVILGLKFIENNSYEITKEILNIIQLCHDGLLPKTWESWVKEKIL